MKTTIIILIVLGFILYTGKPSINLKPFSISFDAPYLPFATIFLILALVCYSIQHQKIGHEQGVKETVDYFLKEKRKTKQ